MRTAETVDGLAGFARRGAGTDAERRAAAWLAGRLSTGRRRATLETFWCRPNWALGQAWHVALGLAGSLVSVSHPRTGAVLVLLALLFVIADWQFGTSPGRRLTPERASQNVISEAPPNTSRTPRRVRLVLTANYDAGRLGLAQRPGLRARLARARAATGGMLPGWLGWIAIALALVLITALLRYEGSRGGATGILQLIPTVGLVLALALLLETASADFAPAAGDNATGVAVALQLAQALDAAPPSLAGVEVVLTGAGDIQGIGLRRFLRARRQTYRAANTVVLGIGPCGGGNLRWWHSDGPLAPAAFFARLRELCATLAAQSAAQPQSAHRGRGCSPAFPARMAGLPAITIGCTDAAGLAPRSHTAADTASAIDETALSTAVSAGLLLVDAIDAYLAALPSQPVRQTGPG
jgi:hypothetical protein